MPGWQPIPALFGVVLVVAGVLLGLRGVRWRMARRGRLAARNGALGERHALRLLRSSGYRILGTQQRRRAKVDVNGERVGFDLVVDAVVARGRRRFVAEIKTGPSASLGHRGTRRQLLEYAVAYPGYGVLLVDATRGRVWEVGFPGLCRRRP